MLFLPQGAEGIFRRRKRRMVVMSNFEKRFGKYAVRNLSLALILCYVVGYIYR